MASCERRRKFGDTDELFGMLGYPSGWQQSQNVCCDIRSRVAADKEGVCSTRVESFVATASVFGQLSSRVSATRVSQ